MVTLDTGREVSIGDTVTLIGNCWYTDDHTFQVGDKMTIVEDNPNSDKFMSLIDGDITVEIEGVNLHSHDFK